jgi:hypothetical protein
VFKFYLYRYIRYVQNRQHSRQNFIT